MVIVVKVVVQVRLLPDAEQASGATASRKHCSSAGTAASLRTLTGTLPATSPHAARLRGMRGVSHAPLPVTGKGWTRQSASQPVVA
jgi:hypothetical protein